MAWNRIQHAAYICRFGRLSLTEVLRRPPTRIELSLFQQAIQNILEQEYASTPTELRHED